MYLQRRIAKKLQAVVEGKIEEKVFFGTIDNAIHKTTKSKLKKKRLKADASPDRWHVTFDVMDGDEEEDGDHFDEVLNEDEVRNALELYSKHCTQDPQGIDETSLLLVREYQQRKCMSTGLGGGDSGGSRPSRSSLHSSERNHSNGNHHIYDRPPSAFPISWPYRSKQRKRPINKAAVAFFFFFLFAVRSITSVANQHRKMRQLWRIGEGDSAAKFDQSAAVRLELQQVDVSPDDSDSDNDTQDQQQQHQQQQSFSACLLWMDDNHRMPEWLAYHYFALPLRHLIVAVDPHSATQFNISSHWYDKMNITVWQDLDYTVTDLRRRPGDTKDQLRGKHRSRQSQFYQACCRHLKRLNRTYTTFYDSDEYVTISEEYYAKQRKRNVQEEQKEQRHEFKHAHHASVEFRRQPGHILALIKEYSKEYNHNRTGSFHNTSITYSLARTCIHVPRALYSVVESGTTKRDLNVPNWLDANQFDTLRYRYRLTKRGARDGLGKAIIDVSRVTEDDIDEGGITHKPLKRVCPSINQWRDYGSLPLGLHHYLGSWESYSFRDDARKGTLRRRDIWLERATSDEGGSDDEIREWILGFALAENVLAPALLLNAGLSMSQIEEQKNRGHWDNNGWE